MNETIKKIKVQEKIRSLLSKGKTYRQISNILNIDQVTVYYIAKKKYFIPVVSKCLLCDIKYTKYANNRKYCDACSSSQSSNGSFLRRRFILLNRSNFTCQYCGRRAPEVKLEIDHIKPKCKGGNESMPNLAVSCYQCNIGKGDILLKRHHKFSKKKLV